MALKRFTLNSVLNFDFGICDYSEPIGSLRNICELLNDLHEENQIKLEILDAFILGMIDEKGIAPEDKEFQCRMNHTIKVLQRLKEEMVNPTEFKRLKELKQSMQEVYDYFVDYLNELREDTDYEQYNELWNNLQKLNNDIFIGCDAEHYQRWIKEIKPYVDDNDFNYTDDFIIKLVLSYTLQSLRNGESLKRFQWE